MFFSRVRICRVERRVGLYWWGIREVTPTINDDIMIEEDEHILREFICRLTTKNTGNVQILA